MDGLFRFFLWTAVVLGVVVGVARLTAIRWWQVPEDDPMLAASITPSVRAGDWVLLWRATPPPFGALVVCPDPEDPARVVIGRLVGEEGDTLTIEGDKILLDDKEAHTESACAEVMFEVEDPVTGSLVEQYCDIEALGGVAHMRGTFGGVGRQKTRSSRVVSEGNVFLVSDNRAYPHDSRHYGAVERATCKESLFFRLTSAEGWGDVKHRMTYIR